MDGWQKRELARDMRRNGFPLKRIAEQLSVSESTVSRWSKDIEPGLLRSGARSGRARRAKRQAEEFKEIADARVEARSHSTDPFWVAGLVAYWAEGRKTANWVCFTNSDPAMVRLFVVWVERYLGKGPELLSAALHLHSGIDEDEPKTFWSRVTDIPRDNFRRSYIKPQSGGQRTERLYRGTAQVTIQKSSKDMRRIRGWIESYSEAHNRFGYTAAGAASSTGRAKHS